MLQLDYAYTRPAHRRSTPPYLTGLGFVIILHAAMITVLMQALDKVRKPVPPPDISVNFIPENKELPPLPPPTPPVIERPPPLITPPVSTVIITPPPGPRNTITEPVVPALPTAPIDPVISETPVRVIASTQTGPAYPVISRRLGEEGAVRLRLTIGIDGRVVDATVISSSGAQRLDEAAMRWVRRNWRYEPAMRGDMPIEATTEATIRFDLE